MNAPTLSELEETTVDEIHEIEVKQPTIHVVGAGGCGTNLIKGLLQTNVKFDSNIKLTTIDTSKSNAGQLPKQIEVHSIGDLGSGKDRAKNVTAITKYLDNHKNFVTQASDITLILFSMAGGSGSVIAPLLAHRLMRNSTRAVILVGVADSSSKRDCINTINTIKTLSKFATDNKYYLPLMLFSNIEVGRVAVNKTVIARLIELVDMLTNRSITEVDYTDKLNYLRPTQVGCPEGCYLLSISATEPEMVTDLPGEMDIVFDEGDMVHACLVVNDTGKTPRILTSVTYTGLSDNKKFFSTIGTPIPQEIVNELNETAERYTRNDVSVDKTSQVFDGLDNHEDSSGIIL